MIKQLLPLKFYTPNYYYYLSLYSVVDYNRNRLLCILSIILYTHAPIYCLSSPAPPPSLSVYIRPSVPWQTIEGQTGHDKNPPTDNRQILATAAADPSPKMKTPRDGKLKNIFYISLSPNPQPPPAFVAWQQIEGSLSPFA